MTPELRQLFIMRLTCFVAFKKRPDGITFCNEFLQTSSFLWGCPDLEGKLIRQMHEYVIAHPERWPVVTYSEAQLAANQGDLVVALWSDPEPAGDHGNLIIPGKLADSGTFGCPVPQCANVGQTNFYGKPLSFGFNALKKPTTYRWRGDE